MWKMQENFYRINDFNLILVKKYRYFKKLMIFVKILI